MLKIQKLTKIYRRGSEDIYAVRDIDLEIASGDYIAFTGPSGSGKTTLVNLLGCLDNPSSGDLTLDGIKVFGDKLKISETRLTKIRRKVFGYVFQKFFLIPTLTVWENILLPQVFFQKTPDASAAHKIMDFLGLSGRKNHLPSQLSGGEMQRAALARALANEPEILIADEPTGNLDSKRSTEIAEIFKSLNQEKKLTIILVTHNPAFASQAKHCIELKDGQIYSRKSTEAY